MDIAAWLRELGLERYEQALRDNDIEVGLLPELTEADLEKIGVTSLGHRKMLLRAVAGLQLFRVEPASKTTASAEETSGTRPTSVARSEAERRQLTVMFVDLVGSTELSARLDPEDMSTVIRAYQNAVAGEITRFEGHIAKYMGDGVLAYFGYPKAHEDEAERAVRAALALADAVGKLATPADEPLAARVGIATGLVVVGELIGEGSSEEQAVVGETPNLAARLQTLAEPGGVVIAAGTRRLLGELFELADLGTHDLKGFAEPVAPFLVKGERTTPSRFEARSASALLPMVARDQELALLLERWAQAKAGEGQGVLLVGEAGIGKSRISRALLDAVARDSHTRIRYQCSPYHTDSALWPVILQLGHAAGFVGDEPNDSRLDKLETLLAQAGGNVQRAAPFIADLIGLDYETRYGALNLTPQAQRSRTLELLVEQLLGLAARQPVLVVLEDAHWVDPTTLELIEQSLGRIAAARAMILLTSRPDHQPELAAHPHVTRLTLNRLGRSGVEAIVAQLGGEDLQQEIVDTIIARTDGVPLFVEELTKAVLESGLLRDAGDHFALDGSLPPLAIPTTLHDSLMARLDHLAPAKEVAQIGAVIGREFGHTILAAVADRADADLGAALDQLVEAELILRHRSPLEATYSFKHALVRDAAYESLLKSRRQVLHDRICVVLEQDFPETAPEVLGAHASSAGRIDAAIGYWEQAGRAAYERAAHKEAIAHYRGALDLLAQLPDTSVRRRMETGLLIGLGAPTGSLVGFGAAETEEVYRQALAVCDREPNPGAAAAALGALCFAQHCRGDERVAKETAEREMAEAERDGEGATLQAAYSDLGDSLLMLGEFSAAAETLGRISEDQGDAIEAAAEVAGRDALVQAASIRAVALWHLGMPDTALSTIGAAVVRGSRSPRPLDQIFPVSFAAKIHLLRREYVEARQHAKRVVQLGKETGVVHFLYDGLVWLGWALVGLDEIDDGLDAIRRGIDGRRTIESFVAWPLFLLIQAYALRHGGQSESALDTLDEAIQWTERGGDRHWLAEIHRQRGTMALMHERSNIDPEAEMRRALDVARGQEARSQELRATTSLARLWAEQGERRKAHNLLAPIHDWFTEGFDTADLKDAKALLDELR